MNIYISGKISGDPKFKEKFKNAFYFILENKEKLFPDHTNNFSLFNPANVDLPENSTWEDYMRYDIKILTDCNAIYMLKDWQESEGAKLEHQIAKKLKMKIIYETE